MTPGDPGSIGEFGLIRWIRSQAARHDRVRLGVGDDCAVIRVQDSGELLVTTDMLMDGRHFRLNEDGPEAVGYKSLAVNLSDIAAMAGVPIAAQVAVALPRHDAVSDRAGAVRGHGTPGRAVRRRALRRRHERLGWATCDLHHADRRVGPPWTGPPVRGSAGRRPSRDRSVGGEHPRPPSASSAPSIARPRCCTRRFRFTP